jgi:hypothetical protein
MYSGGKRHTKPKGSTRERGVGGAQPTSRPWPPCGGRDGGFSPRRASLRYAALDQEHARLVSGVTGKVTVAASRPPWITMERLACFAASRDRALCCYRDRLMERQ